MDTWNRHSFIHNIQHALNSRGFTVVLFNLFTIELLVVPKWWTSGEQKSWQNYDCTFNNMCMTLILRPSSAIYDLNMANIHICFKLLWFNIFNFTEFIIEFHIYCKLKRNVDIHSGFFFLHIKNQKEIVFINVITKYCSLQLPVWTRI